MATEVQFWDRMRTAINADLSMEKIEGTLQSSVHLQRLEPFAQPGVPDVNGCYRGQEFWAELKILLPSGRFKQPLKKTQHSWIHRRVRAGGLVWIVALSANDNVFFWPGSVSRDLLLGLPCDVPWRHVVRVTDGRGLLSALCGEG